jgi:hypothetical protein
MATGRKPSKPWRVYGARGISEDYRSQRAAYEAVATLTKLSVRATVWHWEEGRWVKYEVIEPGDVSFTAIDPPAPSADREG